MKTVSTETGHWLSGRIGKIVGASWKGIPYIRSLPKPRTSPDSQSRLTQQAKFRLAVGFVTAFKGLWQISFESPGNLSPFNYMVSYTVKNAIAGSFPNLSIDYEKILVSHGRLPGVETALIKAVEPGQIEFNWKNNAGTGSARDNDTAILAAYDPELGIADFSIGSATRLSQQGMLEINHNFAGKMHCYLGFVNEKRMIMANSVYAGELQMPER